MAGTTPNYGLATDVQTDDLVEPWHHNRLADTLDRALGEMVRHLLGDGVHAGWMIEETRTVTEGTGLIGGCWCGTGTSAGITGLTNGAVNYVYAVAGEGSAPDGSVTFVAQLAPPGPGRSVLLGTIELATDGSVVAVDNGCEGAQRDRHGLVFGHVSGSGVEEDVGANETVEIAVDHRASGEFRVPGDLRVTSDSPGFTWVVLAHHRGDGFVIAATNDGMESADFEYDWEREGLLR